MIRVFVTFLLASYSPTPDLAVKFNDISITRTLGLAKTLGFDLDLAKYGLQPIEGRIGFLRVEMRQHVVVIIANNINIKGDPIESVAAFYNRKTKWWSIKARALGGIIEVEGVLP